MTRLHLSPLPSTRTDEDCRIPVAEREGFVDDATVLALIAGPTATRTAPESAALALAADDMDFAGWCLPSAPDRQAPVTTPITPPQRPTPPVQEEPGIGQPHCGRHRWWLAGLAGAMTTLLFSALLISLSSRISTRSDQTVRSETPATPGIHVPSETKVPEKQAPQFTDISP